MWEAFGRVVANLGGAGALLSAEHAATQVTMRQTPPRHRPEPQQRSRPSTTLLRTPTPEPWVSWQQKPLSERGLSRPSLAARPQCPRSPSGPERLPVRQGEAGTGETTAANETTAEAATEEAKTSSRTMWMRPKTFWTAPRTTLTSSTSSPKHGPRSPQSSKSKVPSKSKVYRPELTPGHQIYRF